MGVQICFESEGAVEKNSSMGINGTCIGLVNKELICARAFGLVGWSVCRSVRDVLVPLR